VKAIKNAHKSLTVGNLESPASTLLHSFSHIIERNQVDAEGLAILRFLAAQGEGASASRETLSRQFCDRLDSTLNLLLRRELIEQVGDRYRF
jgi:hypothetical protein